MTPARRQTAVENLTFSTPSGHLSEDMGGLCGPTPSPPTRRDAGERSAISCDDNCN